MTGPVVRFRVSAQAMRVLKESELVTDPRAHAARVAGVGRGVLEAFQASHALLEAPSERRGPGTSFVVAVPLGGARAVGRLCREWGAVFTSSPDVAVRADGRALLRVAEHIADALAAVL